MARHVVGADGLLAITAATAAAIWRIGSRLEKKERLEEAYGVSQP
jgi:hypothetical protein